MTGRPLLIGLREVRSFLADPGALLFAFALPLVLVALMLAAFGGELSFSGTAWVVDRDGGPQAARFIETLESIDGLSVNVVDPEDAESRINRSAILMYTEIPAGFSDAISSGQPVEVIQYQRGGGGQNNQIISSMIRGVLQNLTLAAETRLQTQAVLDLLEVEGVPDEALDQRIGVAMEQMARSPAVSVEEVLPEGLGDAPLAASLFPRITSWMILFVISLGAQTFILERRGGTLERLLTTRLTLNELFIGKWFAYFLRGFVQFVVLFAIGALAFDFFTLSNWLSSVLFGLVVTAAVASIGMIVAGLARTENQATWGAVFFTMGMAIFGGTFWDSGTGNVFGVIGKLTVTWWMNTGFDALLVDGKGLGAVATPVLILAVITVAGLVIGRTLFRPLLEGAHG